MSHVRRLNFQAISSACTEVKPAVLGWVQKHVNTPIPSYQVGHVPLEANCLEIQVANSQMWLSFSLLGSLAYSLPSVKLGVLALRVPVVTRNVGLAQNFGK